MMFLRKRLLVLVLPLALVGTYAFCADEPAATSNAPSPPPIEATEDVNPCTSALEWALDYELVIKFAKGADKDRRVTDLEISREKGIRELKATTAYQSDKGSYDQLFEVFNKWSEKCRTCYEKKDKNACNDMAEIIKIAQEACNKLVK